MLSDTFGDCVLGELDGTFPANRPSCISGYEYDEDSDIEDDANDDGDSNESTSEVYIDLSTTSAQPADSKDAAVCAHYITA